MSASYCVVTFPKSCVIRFSPTNLTVLKFYIIVAVCSKMFLNEIMEFV